MLVLGRRLHEAIRIGNDIVITIEKIQGGRVRVGVAAPKSIPVHRKEVYDTLMEELRKQQDAVQDAEHEAGTETAPATDGLSFIISDATL